MLPTFEANMVVGEDAGAARTVSPLTGRELSGTSAHLQRKAAELPAWKYAEKICACVRDKQGDHF